MNGGDFMIALRDRFATIGERFHGLKTKIANNSTKIGVVGATISGSTMAMIVPASAAEETSLTSGLANVTTLLQWAWTAIQGNTFLFTIFCMSLASMAFGLMHSAKHKSC